jgi:hypothetical protein
MQSMGESQLTEQLFGKTFVNSVMRAAKDNSTQVALP